MDREEVLRHWTIREFEKRGEATDDLRRMDETALLGALMGRTSGENHPVWRPREVRWYHTPVSESQFRRLHVVHSPDDLGWDRVAPDGSVMTAARRIHAGTVTDDTSPQVDVETIRRIADRLPNEEIDDIVVVGSQSTAPPRVVDGNHRATAVALAWLRAGRFPDIDLHAYVGVVQSRPLRSLVAKGRWLLRGWLRDEWW